MKKVKEKAYSYKYLLAGVCVWLIMMTQFIVVFAFYENNSNLKSELETIKDENEYLNQGQEDDEFEEAVTVGNEVAVIDKGGKVRWKTAVIEGEAVYKGFSFNIDGEIKAEVDFKIEPTSVEHYINNNLKDNFQGYVFPLFAPMHFCINDDFKSTCEATNNINREFNKEYGGIWEYSTNNNKLAKLIPADQILNEEQLSLLSETTLSFLLYDKVVLSVFLGNYNDRANLIFIVDLGNFHVYKTNLHRITTIDPRLTDTSLWEKYTNEACAVSAFVPPKKEPFTIPRGALYWDVNSVDAAFSIGFVSDRSSEYAQGVFVSCEEYEEAKDLEEYFNKKLEDVYVPAIVKKEYIKLKGQDALLIKYNCSMIFAPCYGTEDYYVKVGSKYLRIQYFDKVDEVLDPSDLAETIFNTIEFTN